MRISRLEIDRWRNLADFAVDLNTDARFICLVGANGSGKSNLLELIAYAAPHFGLTTELIPKRPFPSQRGQPFKIAVTLDLEGTISTDGFVLEGHPPEAVSQWDGTLIFSAEGITGPAPPAPSHLPLRFDMPNGLYSARGTVLAGGLGDVQQAFQLASRVQQELMQRQQVLHLFIDAERVFPEVSVSDAEVLERSRQNWREPSIVRQQAAIATQNLYIEWMRALLGEQQRLINEYWSQANEANLAGNDLPRPSDPLNDYRAALREVLPHLEFVRLDQDQRRLIFDSAGSELHYEDLSGGERELAFLVGQMERFGVKDGLFMLDEPELHLNAELLQRWLGYLRSSSDTGQVWIATHSLEAVEASGDSSTLVLDRGADRRVRRLTPLGQRPALRTLAPLLGTPAFSLSDTTFVLIEGDRPGRERERFAQVTGAAATVRFVEAGGCPEVGRRFGLLSSLASETEQLQGGAFVDRDHRSDEQVRQLEADTGVKVLPVHEIENFFLHPDLIAAMQDQAEAEPDPLALVREAADERAGIWIWERAVANGEWRSPPAQGQDLARKRSWTDFEADSERVTTDLLALFADDAEGQTKSQRRATLARAISGYRELRNDRDQLWKAVEGKEILKAVSSRLGFIEPEALESRAAKLWRDGSLTRPEEATRLLAEIENFAIHGGSAGSG